MSATQTLQALLEEGVASGVFPTARAVVLHEGATLFDGGPAPADARFDLASVTKVMCSTALVCQALDAGVLALGTRVGDFFPGAAAAHATVADLMHHRAGLPPYLVDFADVLRRQTALGEAAPHQGLRAETREAILRAHLAAAPVRPTGAAAVYSDISFVLIGAMLERCWGAPLDVAFEVHVARPLGLHAGFRRLSMAWPVTTEVPTQDLRPRDPAPGQEGLWAPVPQQPARPGEVDDDTCFVMDGVAGHAGLFGTARDVATFGQAVLEGRIKPPSPWGPDETVPGSTRAFGFDTPGTEAPSCGARFGPRAIGHLGFTGTSVWVDLSRRLVVALVSNRTRLGRDNLKIRAFRPRFHEAVLDCLS